MEIEKQENQSKTSFVIQFTSNGHELFITEVETGASKEKASANEVLGNFKVDDEIEVVLMTKNSENEITFLDKLKIPIICLDRMMPSPLTIIEDGIELDILFNVIDDTHLTDELLFASFDSQLEEQPINREDISDENDNKIEEINKNDNLIQIEEEQIRREDQFDKMLEMMSPEHNLAEGKKKLHQRQNRKRIWKLQSVQIYQAFKISLERILESESTSTAIELLHSITDFLSAASKFIFMVIVDLSVEFFKLMDKLLTDFLQHLDTIVDRLIEGSLDQFLLVSQQLISTLWVQYRALNQNVQQQQHMMLSFTKSLVNFSVVKANPLLRIIVRRAQPLVEAGSPIIIPVSNSVQVIRKSRLFEGNRIYGSYLSKLLKVGEELIEEAVTAYEKEND